MVPPHGGRRDHRSASERPESPIPDTFREAATRDAGGGRAVTGRGVRSGPESLEAFQRKRAITGVAHPAAWHVLGVGRGGTPVSRRHVSCSGRSLTYIRAITPSIVRRHSGQSARVH